MHERCSSNVRPSIKTLFSQHTTHSLPDFQASQYFGINIFWRSLLPLLLFIDRTLEITDSCRNGPFQSSNQHCTGLHFALNFPTCILCVGLSTAPAIPRRVVLFDIQLIIPLLCTLAGSSSPERFFWSSQSTSMLSYGSLGSPSLQKMNSGYQGSGRRRRGGAATFSSGVLGDFSTMRSTAYSAQGTYSVILLR